MALFVLTRRGTWPPKVAAEDSMAEDAALEPIKKSLKEERRVESSRSDRGQDFEGGASHAAFGSERRNVLRLLRPAG